jgi:hypothetical protein
VILLMSAAAGAAAAAQSEQEGRSLFLACEFKQAARAFEKASAEQPDSAVLHFWLGKSYARLAEVSSPLSAPKNARKARRSLDSPEWFSGGLERAAALLERIDPGESGTESRLRQLADSRKEHSGAGWWIERAVLWTSGAIGYFVPQP